MAMTKQFTKTQWNNDREPAITAEQLDRMEKGIDDNDTRIVELDKAVTANKTVADTSLAEVKETLQKHTEDISTVNTELTSQGKAIGELADKKITKFYASSQGDTTLNDSDSGKMQDMMLYGKSSQVQYSGKNILQLVNSSELEVIWNSNGILKTNGTLSESKYFANAKEFTIPKGDYTFSISGSYRKTENVSNRSSYVFIRKKSDNTYLASVHLTDEEKKTFSLTEDTVIFCGFADYEINVSHNETIYIQLEKGGEKTSWEPYVGGILSPNPDYPQEIKSVVEPVVKVTGKNLAEPLMPTSTSHGVTCTNNGNGTYTLNGTANGNASFRLDQPTLSSATNLKQYKGKYTLSRSNTSYRVCLMRNSTWVNVIDVGIGYKSATLSIDRNNCFVVIVAIDGTTYNNVLVDVQLEKNDVPTNFEPYREQSVTLSGITLNAIPVSSGGNVTIDGQQYISDYVDVERGKIVRMCAKISLNVKKNGTSFGSGLAWFENAITNRKVNSSFFAKEYTYEKDVDKAWLSKVPCVTYIYNKNTVRVYDSSDKASITLNLLYQLATPTEESLPDELVEKLKALQTYYPQTNLFITSNQLDGYAIFNYPVSLAQGWNYVKQQIGDTRDYIYDMDLQMAQAYVNSEYAVALTELEV